MNDTIIYTDIDALQTFMATAFEALGLSEADAVSCAAVLAESDRRGIRSHGISRLNYFVSRLQRSQIDPVAQPEVVRQLPATALVDGHHGMGMVSGILAMELAIEKARQYGVGAVAVRNSSHYGIAGYYPLMAVAAGMVGLTCTNASPRMAPTFGTTPLLGTNPIAIGFPTDEDFPFIFDAATSVIAQGKLEVARQYDRDVPPGWVIDGEGHYLAHPDDILARFPRNAAALLPLGGEGETTGGHKGYGLGIAVEALSAALQSGAFLSALADTTADGRYLPQRRGHFFAVLNIEAFTEPAAFKQTSGALLRELRAARRQPGAEQIYTPGEKSHARQQQIEAEGVPLPPPLQAELRQISAELGISTPF
jgi:LDH2 family malate/lactate/ureidoglycolate dehydrogenase